MLIWAAYAVKSGIGSIKFKPSLFCIFIGIILFICFLSKPGIAGNAVQSLANNLGANNTNLKNSANKLGLPGNSNAEISAAMNSSEPHSPQADDFNPGEIIIHWTAPGDDGHWGRSSGYDLRYRPQYQGPIDTEEKWTGSFRVQHEPRPSVPGRIDSMVISGLNYSAGYYFSLRSFDDAGNYSALSNSPLIISGDTAHGEIIPGDANGSGAVNGLDILYLIDYLEGRNPPPSPYLSGDANGDCDVNGLDVIYLMNFFKGTGDYPTPGDCASVSFITNFVFS